VIIHPYVVTTFWVLVSALDIFTIVRAVSRGVGVEGTLAWIFFIVAFPGVGGVTYLLLASPSIKRTAKRKRRSRASVRESLSARARADRTPDVALSRQEESILELATALAGLPPSARNSVELLADSERAFEEFEEAVRGAKKSIWAEYYIIRNDETGRRFLDILAEKTREGVEVRLLYDAFGSLRIDAGRLAAIRAGGGKAEVFLSLNPLRRRWSVHLRNHRKMIIIDGQLGFTGGMNVGDEYSGRLRRRGGQRFHDSHLAIRGPAVGDLMQAFAEDWLFATEETIDVPAPPAGIEGAKSIVAIVQSGPDQEHNASGLVHFTGVACALERAYLTSPYFIPDQAMVRSLVSAAMRGVDVRLLVPRHCDVAIVGPAGRSYYRELLRGGVRIFEYLPSMLHAKTMVVDGAWGIVGSANVDMRSFRLNFELGALVIDPNFAGLLEGRFLDDLKQSEEVTAEEWSGRGFWPRLRDGVARLLSPLL